MTGLSCNKHKSRHIEINKENVLNTNYYYKSKNIDMIKNLIERLLFYESDNQTFGEYVNT